MDAFDPCRKESSATVTQALLMVLVLSSGLVSLETPLHGVCSPSWAIMAQYQSCPFRPESREGVSVLPQKSQAASCLGVSIHHVLARSLSTSLLPHIVWLGLLLLQDHGDLCLSLLSSSHSPLTWLPSAARHCTFLKGAMAEAGVTSFLWAVAADLLGCCLQPLLLIQNLLIQVGRVKCIMALGFL